MNKYDVLLTQDEWVKLWKEYSEAVPLPSIDWAETLLRAELKKIVKWLNDKCTEHPIEKPYLWLYRSACPECMQSLKEIAGMK